MTRQMLLCLFVLLPLSQALGLDAAAWRADLAQLDEAIRRDHKSPFHTVSEADYTQMVQSLREDIPTLGDQEIIVRMASIVASVNDGHTRLSGWMRDEDWGFESLPVHFYRFTDGIYVRQAHPDHLELLGAKLVAVGQYSADEAFERVLPVMPADNRWQKEYMIPLVMNCPQILAAVGLIEASEPKPFEFEKDGKRWKPELAVVDEWPGQIRGFVVDAGGWLDAGVQPGRDAPLWRRHVEEPFWFELLENEKILYVQQNQVLNGQHETLEDFYARVQEQLDQNEVEKLVLDVRLNSGGNNYLNKPCLTLMVRADAELQTYTIIGRRTFSACQNLVNELSRWTNTIFIGEPTAERVNFYGDTKSTTLANSGLEVHASWLWWQNMDPRDTRDALYPDLSARLSFADYAAGIDPAMAIVRDFDSVLRSADLMPMYQSQGMDAVRDALSSAIADPRYEYWDIEDEINQMGYRLLGRQQLDFAIEVFQLNVDLFPDSWNAYDSLGEAYENKGEKQRALELFEKSLSLNPESPTGLAAVERLRGSGGDS